MRISPRDLLTVRFRRVLFGLDPEEVQGFLELVREELEALLHENEELRRELNLSRGDLQRLKEEEALLRETLLFAQRIQEEVKAQAEKEAQLIVSDAELRSQKIVAEGMHRAQELERSLRELRELRFQILGELKHLAERILHLVSGYEEGKEQGEEVLLLAPPHPEGRR